jgi:hypothetical protein
MERTRVERASRITRSIVVGDPCVGLLAASWEVQIQ